MARDALLAQIHIAKKEVGMDDGTYRLFLENTTGRTSSKGMSDRMKRTVITAFKDKGWKPSTRKKGAKQRHIPKANDARARLIFGLWTQLGKLGGLEKPSRAGLFAFCRRMTKERHAPDGIDNPDWLTENADFDSIIIPLKRMIERKEMESLK